MKIDKFMGGIFIIIHLGMIYHLDGKFDLYAGATIFIALAAYYFLIRVIIHRMKKEALKCEKSKPKL